MSLLFNMLSRLVITFLPRSKRLLLSWLQSPSAVILESRKIKSDTVSTVSPSICHEVMGPDDMIFVFWILSFKPTFSLYSFTFIKRFLQLNLYCMASYLGYYFSCAYPVKPTMVCTICITAIKSFFTNLLLCVRQYDGAEWIVRSKTDMLHALKGLEKKKKRERKSWKQLEQRNMTHTEK